MSLYNNTDMYSGPRKIDHGDSEVKPSETVVDISEVHNVRVMGEVEGKDGATAGTFTIHIIGKLGTWEKEVTTLTITPTGTAKVYEQKLVDMRGFEEVKTKLSFTNAATQYVMAQVKVGVPHVNVRG